ncbi:hypothetical protein QR680_007967 [Steinernema hermaphroditum]|uniref:Uncharacterized protein n=1 Tax=Steinernema hermaphroditum TaxID=289476 RepID=A0AA39M6Z9_9BILA|nr:hypothetical protein QR680_007967 [Steinernema hermaphroditum]
MRHVNEARPPVYAVGLRVGSQAVGDIAPFCGRSSYANSLMSSHEGVPKNGSQQPRTTLAGLQLGLGGRPTSGNGSAPHLPPPQATTSGIVQPAPVRIQPGSFDAQVSSTRSIPF